jgi:uracil-DNA glycosylase
MMAPLADRLQAPLDAAFDAVPPEWRGVTDPWRNSLAGQVLCSFVDGRIEAGATIYPPQVFRALTLTPPDAVRVVILGQDPYHGPGEAQGLAFSVVAGQRLPPSLRNILQEVASDIGRPSVCTDGDLSRWAAQGVLLLNTVLTVERDQPQSHAGHGWEALTDLLIGHLAAHAEPMVFMLWGASAQRKRLLLDSTPHHVLTANHPSPLAARRPPQPFIGCRHFSAANTFLETQRPSAGVIHW